jgi:hypothetical protein
MGPRSSDIPKDIPFASFRGSNGHNIARNCQAWRIRVVCARPDHWLKSLLKELQHGSGSSIIFIAGKIHWGHILQFNN